MSTPGVRRLCSNCALACRANTTIGIAGSIGKMGRAVSMSFMPGI
jgi:hypothetical protein